MDDYFSRAGRQINKKNILISIILILAMGLFFSAWFDQKALAKQGKKTKISQEAVDPLNKIKKGFVTVGKKGTENICEKSDGKKKKALSEEDKKEKEREEEIRNMVAGHPIEEMAEIISRRDEKTAAFLVAIARKESSWGLHAPHVGTRDCFNYWGYKGSYKLNMGYSCFDSKEQAVAVVGDKIKSLIDRKIDTPERFVVWKCGSSCAGHDPKGVQKWISDVRGIFYKLNS